jgi:hypothetical protein
MIHQHIELGVEAKGLVGQNYLAAITWRQLLASNYLTAIT